MSPRALVQAASSSAEKPAAPVARLAYSKAEAAEALGCSVDFLEEHVLPELRVVRRGRRRFIAVSELERWLEANGSTLVEAHRDG